MAYFKHQNALVSDEARIGEGTRIWAFSNVQGGAVIGDNCNICDCCFIEGKAVLGHNVTIKNGVAVYDGVTLEDDVFVGPNVAFVNDRYPKSRHAGWEMECTRVKKGAALGANATILCGVTIGEGALVGAGSVVVKDVPARTIVIGNPARKVGQVGTDGKPVKAAWKNKAKGRKNA